MKRFSLICAAVITRRPIGMKNRTIITMTLTLFLGTLLQAQSLEESFKSPPDSAKPYTWWHWVSNNASKEGITKDLEAMKAVGLGGFTLFDAAVGGIPY